MLRPICTKLEFVFDWCVCVASLGLLVVFSVRDVGFKKTPFLGAGSVFVFLTCVEKENVQSSLRCPGWGVACLVADHSLARQLSPAAKMEPELKLSIAGKRVWLLASAGGDDECAV